MSNKISMKKLDIKQWEVPIIVLLKELNESKSQSMHIEDIAIKSKKMFPSFFTWSKYKENIDLRKFNRTLDQLSAEGFIVGSNATNWSLSKKGIELGQIILKDKLNFNNNISHKKNFGPSSDFYKRDLVRLKGSKVFLNYLDSGNFESSSDMDMKYLIKLDHYANKKRIIKNICTLYIACRFEVKLNIFLDAYRNELIKRKIITNEINQEVERNNE